MWRRLGPSSKAYLSRRKTSWTSSSFRSGHCCRSGYFCEITRPISELGHRDSRCGYRGEAVNPIGGQMSPKTIFNLHLILGYVAWLLCFRTYLLPRLKSMDQVEAHRAIATLHSFRFYGLVFILPGVVGNLPASFAPFPAHWDLATGVIAILALLTVRVRPLFWLFVIAFNLVGVIDLILDYYHAVRIGLPAMAGQLGAAYVIPIIYVPLLMITHVVAFYLLLRPQPRVVRAVAGDAAASHGNRSTKEVEAT